VGEVRHEPVLVTALLVPVLDVVGNHLQHNGVVAAHHVPEAVDGLEVAKTERVHHVVCHAAQPIQKEAHGVLRAQAQAHESMEEAEEAVQKLVVPHPFADAVDTVADGPELHHDVRLGEGGQGLQRLEDGIKGCEAVFDGVALDELWRRRGRGGRTPPTGACIGRFSALILLGTALLFGLVRAG